MLNSQNSGRESTVFEFGPFRLDRVERRLTRAGEPVTLQPKVLDLLVALVRREGRLATKDELMRELWPDTFVDEANLTQSVFTLRRALGDGEGERYIETVPKRGYRMAVPISTNDSTPAVEAAAPVARPRAFGARPVALALIVVLLVAASWFACSRVLGTRDFTPATFTRVTRTGDVVDAAMSRDGRFIALVRGTAGRWGLWLHQVATGNTLQIGADQDVRIDKVTFSADGERLYFVKTSPSGTALYAMASLGGPEQFVIKGAASPVAVSPDGSSIAFVRVESQRGIRAIVVARADGSAPREVMARKSPAVIVVYGPAWSPDGRRIAVIVNESLGGRKPELVEVDVNTGLERTITGALPWHGGKVVWHPDGRSLLVGARQLWRVSYPDGQTEALTQEASDYGYLSLSADGRTLMTVRRETQSAVWLAEGERLGNAVEVLKEAGLNHGVAWTADGRLLYESRVDADVKVFVADTGGKRRGLLTPGAGTDYFPATDRAGRFFAYSSVRPGSTTIWRRAFDGSAATQLSADGTQYGPDVSPDGQWVAYHRADPARSWTIWRVSANGGAPSLLTDRAATFPVFSPDGRRIVCNLQAPGVPGGWAIAILPAEGGEPSAILRIPGPPTRRFAWAPDGRAIYFSSPDDSIRRVRIDDNEPDARPEEVQRFPGEQVVALRWSPDGARLTYVRYVERNDVVLVTSKR